LRAVVLEAPDPPGRGLFYRIQLSMGTLLLESSTYPRRSPLVAVGRSAQRHEALSIRDGREQAGDGGPVQLALPAAPYAPPVVLEALGRGIEEAPLGGGVDCARASMIHALCRSYTIAIAEGKQTYLSRTWRCRPGPKVPC
jgi:hypothetical protein